jgi:hypothetical protein
MSVFRPLNSDESNLCTIRCVIEWKDTTFNSNVIIAAGKSYTDKSGLVTPDFLKTPTTNNLPPEFVIFHNSDQFYVNYGKEFTSCPSVFITPRFTNQAGTNILDNITPCMKWQNITNYHKLYTIGSTIADNANLISATNHNFAFSFKNIDGTLVQCSATVANQTISGFDLMIVGPIKLGVTTGNSNKGWSVGSGNDSNTAYSFMNVGIGTGNPTSALQVQGRLDSYIYKSNTTLTAGPTSDNAVLTSTNLFQGILPVTPTSSISLKPPSAANIIAYLSNLSTETTNPGKNHVASVGDSFNLTIVNGATATYSITLDLSDDTNLTNTGSLVIDAASSTTFAFIITNVTSGSEAITVVRL